MNAFHEEFTIAWAFQEDGIDYTFTRTLAEWEQVSEDSFAMYCMEGEL